MDFFVAWLIETWGMALETAPWVLGGFLLAGILHVLLPAERIAAQLGRPGWGSVVKASLAGIPLPLCSCSVIPVASSLRQRGASRGATASFLISTPETGVDSIAISYALLGPFMAVARPVAALVTAVLTGALVDKLGGRDAVVHSRLPVCNDRCGEAAPAVRRGWAARLVEALRYGLIDMFVDLAPSLALGFALAGLISVLVPAGSLERYVGSGWGPMLLMLVVGLPMYVCATSSTPVAAALIAKGLSPGAALVFLLAGPATNIATMLVVARDLGKAVLAVYVACIAAVALAAGWITDRWMSAYVVVPGGFAAEIEAGGTAIEWLLAAVFLALLVHGLWVRARRRLGGAPAITA